VRRDLGIALGVVALTVAFAAWDPDSGLRTWWALQQDAAAARARIGQLRDEIARDEGEIRALREDPLAQERAIREDLGFARPGETVVRLGPPRTVGGPAPSRPLVRLAPRSQPRRPARPDR